MLPISEIPLEVIAWTVGGVACTSLGLRALFSYMSTRNEVSKCYAGFGITLGIGEFLYQLPAWFTQDTAILRLWALAGDLFIYASMILLARVIWVYSLRRVIRFGQLAGILVAWTAITWVIDFFTSSVTTGIGSVQWTDVPLAAAMRGILYAAVLLPNGWYLLRRAITERGARARLRAYALGAAILIGGGAIAYEDITNRGFETHQTDLLFLIIFTVMIITIWTPVVLRSLGSSRSTKGQ